MFDTLFKSELSLIENHLQSLLTLRSPVPHSALSRFWECMNYSLLSPGKRFRPLLSLLTARSLDRPLEHALPMAAAVELVHTYSLVHDDLPCMDNDDMRRGKPTNHKVYGEAQALLAGDALLTMAFGALGESQSGDLRKALALLAEAAGAAGMVGGQVLDIESLKPDRERLAEIHKRKTGALIRVSVEGAAALVGALPEQLTELRAYGEKLGLAFQLADDLQDYIPDKPEKINYAALIGVDETKNLLKKTSDGAIEDLRNFDESADGLRQMVRFNLERI